ncbi:MAG TPA: phospholipase [Phycisphaerales bacterium]|nr:phospholipase [Phycisphaerales bacterium]|tara:strand:- start:171 stop:728 length:558 start_codon:yes stop_codon:yes gene_type:complete
MAVAPQLITNEQHFEQVVLKGMLKAEVSLDISTADFKAMLVPTPGSTGSSSRSRRAPSIVTYLSKLAKKGVEIRLLHAGVPSSAALRDLKKELPANLQIRRCPRLHAKAVVVDSCAMYLGSANLTGAGLGAKSARKRNFEWGIWTYEARLIDEVLGEFNELWEGCHCENCLRRDVCPVPLEEPSL